MYYRVKSRKECKVNMKKNPGKITFIISIILIYNLIIIQFLKYNLSFIEYCGIGIIVAIPLLLLARYIEKKFFKSKE